MLKAPLRSSVLVAGLVAVLEPIPIGSTISEFQATHSQWERSGFKITGKAVHLSGSCVADQRCKKIWIYQ
jgi:hypothetical protein